MGESSETLDYKELLDEVKALDGLCGEVILIGPENDDLEMARAIIDYLADFEEDSLIYYSTT